MNSAFISQLEAVEMLSLILFVVFCGLVGFALYCRYCYFGRMLAKIPGPMMWPIIGNGLEAALLNQETSYTYVREMRKKYGPISKSAAVFIGIVHIFDPNYVEKLVGTTRYNDKRVPYTFMRSWLSEGLLISNGLKWKLRRKLLTPSFHFSVLKGFCSTFSDHTQRFLKLVEQEEGNDRTDITQMISRTTLGVMCETSMGTTVNTDKNILDKYFNALMTYGDIVQQRVVKVYLHSNWIHKLLPLARKEKKLVEDMHELTKQIIKDRRNYNNNILADKSNKKIQIEEKRLTIDKHSIENMVMQDDKNLEQININNNNMVVDKFGDNKKHRLAMLDQLLDLEKEGMINENGIREEVDTFMFEGHDTTAATLQLMIMRIANETKIQEKIYQEMLQIFGDSDRLPTIEDLHEMKYLERCIKESLRLYPGVPLIARYIGEDLHLDKYTVPEGAMAFIHVYDIHHDANYYPDPERFDPDRFLPDSANRRHNYAYIPFSAGPRNCIGQKFAMYEMKTLISGLLRRYHLDPVTKHEEVTFIADLVLRPKHPLYVHFRKRQTCVAV